MDPIGQPHFRPGFKPVDGAAKHTENHMVKKLKQEAPGSVEISFSVTTSSKQQIGEMKNHQFKVLDTAKHVTTTNLVNRWIENL